MPPHFQNGEKCDGGKISPSVLVMTEQFENGRKFDEKNSLQEFHAKEMYLHAKNRSASFEKRQKLFCFIIFECPNVPVRALFSKSTVSKSAGKQCAVFV